MPHDEISHLINDDVVISPDFLQGDVNEGLERIRKRLLDLSNRNRLLNFKHTKTSSLRVVDEIPDFLYSRLINGKEMSFRPVPNPPRREIEQAGGLRNIDVLAHAKSIGINTSYELEHIDYTENSNTPRNLVDTEIQTLYFPEKLESVVGRISNTARLAIEETGTNMLYLAFGYLEWYEGDDSDVSHLAPLLLLPVSLTRGEADSQTRTFRYYVSYSGEDILPNISLQEKMRSEFSIEVPELSEDETPGSYFLKFDSILRAAERWKIYRYVTLTLLSFGKLLMYKDLDSANWPKGAKISKHARIREFFEGIQHDKITIASDYELDEADSIAKVPLLIDNADSSQHSAIIDALAGKNLVVEGPPGTGKSQTITNLIASALAEGKSILFVSEKLAALEVVRRRLDKAGLGDFCLELHSNKTKKRELLNDVARRWALCGSYKEAATIDARISLLEKQKSTLHRYAKLIGQTVGAANIRIFDLFWRRQLLSGKMPVDGQVVDQLRTNDPKSLTQLEIDTRKQLVGLFSSHLQNVLNAIPTDSSEGSISGHAWLGVTNADLSFSDESNLVANLDKQYSTGQEIIRIAAEFVVRMIDDAELCWQDIVGRTLSEFETFIASVRSLRPLAGGIDPGTLARLRGNDLTHHLQEFVEEIENYRQIATDLCDVFGEITELSHDDISAIRSQLSKVAKFTNPVITIDQVLQLATRQQSLAENLAESSQTIAELNLTFELDYPSTEGGLISHAQFLEALNLAPIEHLHLRQPGFLTEGATAIIGRAAQEAEPIIRAREALSHRFEFSLAPEKEQVIEHISACANARWYKPFDKKYRDAKSAYATFSKEVGKHPKKQVWDGFKELIRYQAKERTFRANEDFQRVFGSNFSGIDTQFDDHAKVGIWLNLIRQMLGTNRESNRTSANHLWQLNSSALISLSGEKQAGPKTKISNGIEAYRAAGDGANNFFKDHPDPSLDSLSDHLKSCSTDAKRLAENLSSRGIPTTLSLFDLHELLDKLETVKVLRLRIDSDTTCGELLAGSFEGIRTDTTIVTNTVLFFQTIENSVLPAAVKTWLESSQIEERLSALRQTSEQLWAAVVSFETRHAEFSDLAGLNHKLWYSTESELNEIDLKSIIDRGKRASDGSANLSDWVQYLQARKAASDTARALSVIELAESGKIEPLLCEKAYYFSVLQSLIDEVFVDHPDLAQFSGLTHNHIRHKFAELDREVLNLFRQRVAFLVDQRHVPWGNGRGPVGTYTDASLLIREIEKQKRHIPIRQLISRAGDALIALKPCFMMGPLSVAQYLPPGRFLFDYVIMDEASQLKPEDALGTIARGKQVIIVGDRKQLPPTSFFDRLGEDAEEGLDESLAQSLEDAESILDVASAVYRPSRMLKWHYRSRHGSLIAFSNREFYDGKLIVFPSPVAKDPQLGVQLKHITAGIYQDRKNMTEAREVVAEVMAHMEKRPDVSLGVVTLNSAQRDLVEELFNEALKENPFAEDFLAKLTERSEPFFVKNLENVQGDERDVIFVSITFGPNEQGRVYQRFGPINSNTGHRRLNVLFTRARQRVVIFSSMTYDQIVVAPDSKLGVKALKGYLEFARTGILESAQFSGREPDSDFEVEVASALRENGFETVAQVGVAGFFIDLAVKHPSKADAFILGIECDGATYHSSRSARDRDRLREEILGDLGWNLHRIWSTDWFRNRSKEVKRLVKSIQSAVAADS